MPGSMTTNGTEELAEMLGRLGREAPQIASQALFEGARIVADEYSAAVESIITAPRGRGEDREHARFPTPEEKAALKNSGIARFNKNGSEVNTIVGEAEGYTTVRGNRKAIKLLARSINSGTHFMHRQPVFRRAASQSRGKAQDAMVAKADELINQIVK